MSLIGKYQNVEISGVIRKGGYCLIDSRVHGLFACFYCVIYGLYICEKEKIHPVIFLGEDHLYYDRSIGENIFNYFYDQQDSLNKATGIIKVLNPSPFIRWCSISSIEKRYAQALIQKYFKLTPEIRECIDIYTKKFANKKVLGIHYRGRDKSTETVVLPFAYYVEKIDTILEKKICDLLFFSSDELELRDVIKMKYKKKVILYDLEGDYNNIADQNHGLHYQTTTPYLHAKDALIECHILASCTMLLSSHSSSMSLFATFINSRLIHVPLES